MAANFKRKGNELRDIHTRLIGKIDGMDVKDKHGIKIGRLDGDYIRDVHNVKSVKMNKENIISFYVKIIKSILEIYRLNQNKNTQKITKRILNWIIREYKGKIKLYASEDAIKWAKSQGINDSLSNYNWKDQVKKKEKGGLGDKKRENLHLEHIIPISQIIKNLFKTKTSNDISNDIQNILNEISVAWIKRDQQQKLDKGHKKARGENLKKCLECCKKYCDDELIEIGEYKVPLDYDNESEKNDIW